MTDIQTDSDPVTLRLALSRLKRSQLATLPTPVEPFLQTTPGTPVSFIKRDDLTGAPGGNKIRKLEYLLDHSERPVVTFGPTGSHHVLATILMCHRLGRSCAAVLVSQPASAHADSINRLIRQNADDIITLQLKDASRLGGFLQKMHRSGAEIVWPGGTSPRGLLGYVEAAVEIFEQVGRAECPSPTEIWVPLGSGGTAAGLALGFALCRLDVRIKAVRVATRLSGNGIYLRRLAAGTMALLRSAGIQASPPKLQLDIVEGFIGKGYGHATAAADQAQRDAAAFGLELEGTYTAKTLAAMRAQSEDRRIRFFLDTYGPPEKGFEREDEIRRSE